MRQSIRLADILIIAATIVAAIIGVVSARSMYMSGAQPPRSLEMSAFPPVDPLRDLTRDDSSLDVVLQSSGRRISNIRTVTTFLTNTGQSPIKPEDIIDNLSVVSRDGWQILNVVTSEGGRVQTNWIRTDENRFSSSKTLLNPGDFIIATVYLTFDGDTAPDLKDDESPISWDGRVVNVSSITEKSNPYIDFAENAGPFFVTLWIWPIITICILIFITSVFFIRSLQIIRAFSNSSGQVLSAFIFVINVCCCEAASSIIFGPSPYDYQSPNLVLNLPIILFNIAVFSILKFAERRRWSFNDEI